MKISDEKLRENIIEVFNLIKKIPTQKDYYEFGKYSTTTYTNRKPWSKWINEIFGTNKKTYESNKKISREELKQNLLELYNKLNRVPKREDLTLSKYGISGYNREFGNFANALIEVGLKPNQRRGLSNEEIIEDVKRIYKKLGKTPTVEEFIENSKTVSYITINNRFGSWNNFLTIASIPVENIHEYSKQEIIDALNSWYNKNNKDVSCLVYWRILEAKTIGDFPYSCGTISKKFNYASWEEIMKTIDSSYETVIQFSKRGYYNGEDDNIYLSSIEKRVGDILYDCKINGKIKDYEYEANVCNRWTCDFKILLNNDKYLWLEVDGMRGSRKVPYNRGNEKIEYYKENNYNYDIVSYNHNVERKMYNIINNIRKY